MYRYTNVVIDWYDHTDTDADYPVWNHIKPIPIYPFVSISNRYRYISLAPYQTNTDNRLKLIIYGYYHKYRLFLPIPISTLLIPIPIPIILFGFISNWYLYRYVKPILIPIIRISIGYTNLADYWSIPTLMELKICRHEKSCTYIIIA